MKLADIPAVAMLIATTAGLGAAVFFSCPPAKADVDQAVINYTATYAPAVCSVLDDYPTFDGIVGIAKGIVHDGFNPSDAGAVIALSINNVCPRHAALMQRFIDRYASDQAQPKRVA